MKKIKAAGALVHRQTSGTPGSGTINKNLLEILLVHRPKYQDWSFPKGKLDPGETAEAAAVREVEEETGVPVALDTPLGHVEYHTEGVKNLQVTTRKSVQYYIAHEISPGFAEMQARKPVKPASEKEIDDVQWVTLSRAEELLTYRDDHKVLRRFAAEIEGRDLSDSSLYIEVKRIKFTELDEKQQKVAKRETTSVLSSLGINCLVMFTSSKPQKEEDRACTFKKYSKKTGIPITVLDDKKSPQWQNLLKSNKRIAIVK
jgi:8-oxo-dGTP pyrophosphatase MutT (NUDIX family)